jgi:hypothetical protein
MAAKDKKKKNTDIEDIENEIGDGDAVASTGKKEKKPKKKKEKKEKNPEGKRGKKGGFPIVPILVLLVLLALIVAVLGFNVFDLRDRYILPYLRSAPLIGSMIPAATPIPEDSPEGYAAMSPEEIANTITALNYQIEKLQADLKTAQDQNTQDAGTIAALRGYESQIEAYRQTKALFDEMVASGNPRGYADFYQSISPENADRIYQDTISSLQFSADDKKLANIYANLDPSNAAAAITELMGGSTDLALRILRNLDTVMLADILSEMTPANVAVITRLLAPTAVPVRPPVTAPPLPTPIPVP